MDGRRFDELTRVLGFSLNRKRFVALVGGLLGAGSAAMAPDGVAAKKGGKHRNGRRGGVGAQGGNGVCDALCSGSGPDPRFCGDFGNCGSDDDCIQQDPARPICCTTGNCGGSGEGACCSAPTCSGFCEKDADCPDLQGCICDESTLSCVSLLCGGECTKDADCPPLAGCSCEVPNGQAVGSEGIPQSGQCVTQACGGPCVKDSDCPTAAGGCICDESSGECVTVVCPGRCNDNDDCTAQGQDQCACIFFDAGLAARATEVGVEGEAGQCGACLGAGDTCDATSECCGQLVCRGSGEGPSQEGVFAGTCQRKPKPKPKPKKDRCGKHGQSCRRDNDCCAQAVCFKGKCGEKDSHCHNDGECAQGYSCQGGPLSPGHRRCRKNGRRTRNRRNKNGQKR